MAENFANTYQTTINDSGGISDSDTSLIVASVTGAPAVNFRIKIDSELILVTNIATLTFTITRGIEGTTPASHSDGATVTHVLTAGGLATTIEETVAIKTPLYVATFDPYIADSITTAFVANEAIFQGYQPLYTVAVDTVWYRVNTTGGNLDMGIYDEGLSLLESTGSFAAPAASTNLSRALSGTVTLTRGEIYYFAFAASSTAFRTPVQVRSIGLNIASSALQLRGIQSSALPLPSTASPTFDGASTTPLPSLIFA